jgi:hypothetical protein
MICLADNRSAHQSGDSSIPKDALKDAGTQTNKPIYKAILSDL